MFCDTTHHPEKANAHLQGMHRQTMQRETLGYMGFWVLLPTKLDHALDPPVSHVTYWMGG